MSVTVRLAHGIDVSRGDMIVGAAAPPIVTQDVEAIVCWMSEVAPLRAGATLAVKHTTRWARARVAEVQHRVDIDTLHLDLGADQLALNEIGRVSLRTTQPLVHDEYRHNRTTGSFILVDEATHTTVGAGMIVGPSTTAP
jgi:bifunctional enzyme CysN/CysC